MSEPQPTRSAPEISERDFDDRSPFAAALCVRAAILRLSDDLTTEDAVMQAIVEAVPMTAHVPAVVARRPSMSSIAG